MTGTSKVQITTGDLYDRANHITSNDTFAPLVASRKRLLITNGEEEITTETTHALTINNNVNITTESAQRKSTVLNKAISSTQPNVVSSSSSIVQKTSTDNSLMSSPIKEFISRPTEAAVNYFFTLF
jgi:2,3-bisphosphoglycerate-independent phosphoglycerate mutase